MSSPLHIVTHIDMKESAIMSVKYPPSLSSPRPHASFADRIFNVLLADWWIDVFLMLFIVACMVWSHYS
ncbi:MAG: hypothetical protein QM749_04525 [Aquabacterium sp.]